MKPNGGFAYTPRANFIGTDSFTYRATNGKLNSTPATVSIKVGNPNTAPVANPDSYAASQDTTFNVVGNAMLPSVLANDTDAQNQALTAAVVAGPANGTLALNPNGTFSYTPNLNFNGPDSFTYRAFDGVAQSAATTVTINVAAVNDAPVGVAILIPWVRIPR